MDEDTIIKMLLEIDILKEALIKIAEFDASERNGYLDEWEEAEAFSECREIAMLSLINSNNLYKEKEN
jgi:hypothetical protein